jgi:hypothetical protein
MAKSRKLPNENSIWAHDTHRSLCEKMTIWTDQIRMRFATYELVMPTTKERAAEENLECMLYCLHPYSWTGPGYKETLPTKTFGM